MASFPIGKYRTNDRHEMSIIVLLDFTFLPKFALSLYLSFLVFFKIKWWLSRSRTLTDD